MGRRMWLVYKSGPKAGAAVEIQGPEFTLGRDASCDLTLADDNTSRRHTIFRVQGQQVVLEDLGSTNGTYVNGWRADRPVLIQGGEQVQLGDSVFEVSATPPASAGQTRMGVAVQRPGQPIPERRSQSAVQRVMLQRSVRRLTIVASLALLVAGVAVALALTGVLGGGDDDDDGPDVSAIVEAIEPSTALITSKRNGQDHAGGTGWVLDAEEGLVVTNYHVVNGGDEFEVGILGDSREALPGKPTATTVWPARRSSWLRASGSVTISSLSSTSSTARSSHGAAPTISASRESPRIPTSNSSPPFTTW
jgi:pSer/pThr/pTyr-binding forkhead associated (FHA) protein